jgi:hypothetical protein
MGCQKPRPQASLCRSQWGVRNLKSGSGVWPARSYLKSNGGNEGQTSDYILILVVKTGSCHILLGHFPFTLTHAAVIPRFWRQVGPSQGQFRAFSEARPSRAVSSPSGKYSVVLGLEHPGVGTWKGPKHRPLSPAPILILDASRA